VAQIWDTETGERLAMKGLTTGKGPVLELHHRDGVTGASFDASGAYVVTTSDNGARVWDAATGAPVTPWLEHPARLNSAVFAPGGGRLLTASADGTARIWETATGRMLLPALEHTESVASAVFSADGRRIVTASADRTAQIWDASGRVPTVKLKPSGFVGQAGFSPDGRRLVTASEDATVRIWDTATGTQQRALAHPSKVVSAAFSIDGARIVTTSDDRVARIWDPDGRTIAAIRLPEVASSATLCPDGTRLITRAGDASRGPGPLRLWNALTGAPVLPSPADTDKIVSAAVNHDCTRLVALVALGQDRTARIWDPVSGKAVSAAIRLPEAATSVAISPDGAQIVTSGKDGTAHIWDVATGQEVAPALDHDQPVVSAAFSPDGARVLTISGDRTAQVWDVKTGKRLTPPLYTDDQLVTAAFSVKGDHLFAADRHTVRTWDVALDDGAPSDWAELARKSPYVLDGGVLVPRALAPRAGAHDSPILSF
jgi:WD40 repeat protein